jgi:hypothetical protein
MLLVGGSWRRGFPESLARRAVTSRWQQVYGLLVRHRASSTAQSHRCLLLMNRMIKHSVRHLIKSQRLEYHVVIA